MISLSNITKKNGDKLFKLKISPNQETFVTRNEFTLAQSFFYPEVAVVRSIDLNSEPIGLIALKFWPDLNRYYIWRMMIDHKHQNRGYGSKALKIIAEELKLKNISEVWTKYKVDEQGPSQFYVKNGFTEIEVSDELMHAKWIF